MTDREKLTALFDRANAKCARTKCPECKYDGDECWDKFLIDYLLENGVTFQQWIPVSERLPESIGLFLVIEKHWIDGSPCRRIAKWNTVDWFTADRKSREITPRVTHWMPLPEKPKEE